MLALAVALVLAPRAVDAAGLDILTRAEWGAKAPIARMTPQTPARITLHHPATRQKPATSTRAKLQALQAFSQSTGKLADGRAKKAWADVPYHYYVAANGEVAEGRGVGFVGDTNTGYDPTGHIAIVVEGNFETETPSPRQVAAIVDPVVLLASRPHLGPAAIGAHRDSASTACPGRNLGALVGDIRADVARQLAN